MKATEENELPAHVQEMTCEAYDNECFGIDFVLMLALKIAITAVPGWQQVLVVSCFQAICETAQTKFTMWLAWRNYKQALETGDSFRINVDKAKLSLKVVKHLSDMLLEYFAIAIVIAGGVVFSDNYVVRGFGSFTKAEAVSILTAQF